MMNVFFGGGGGGRGGGEQIISTHCYIHAIMAKVKGLAG